MKELSVFVDESGVLGPYDVKDPYYVLSFVFHNQKDDISSEMKYFEANIRGLGFKIGSLHTGPIIRREEDYKNVDRKQRQKIFMEMMSFLRRSPIMCKAIYIEKKHLDEPGKILKRLTILLKRFLEDNLVFFQSFDIVKIYYDNGQIPIAKMLIDVFKSVLSNVIFIKVKPSQYRLFQISDMICTLKLIELKMQTKSLTKSELAFFDYSEKIIRKQYLKRIEKKTLK